MAIVAAKARSRDIQRVLRSQRGKEAIIGVLFALPWLVRLFAMDLFPIVSALRYSFTQYSIISAPIWIGFDNYVKMFTRDTLPMKALGNSVYYSLGAVPLDLVIALLLAILLNQQIRFRSVYRVVFFIPSVVPADRQRGTLAMDAEPPSGLINYVLTSIRAASRPLDEQRAVDQAGVHPDEHVGRRVATVIFLAGLQDIPQHLYEAAEIDGAGLFQRSAA